MLKIDPSLGITPTRQRIRQSVTALLSDARYKSVQISFDVDPA